MRCLLLALVLFLVAPIAAQAQTSTPGHFDNGFGQLSDQLGDQSGSPLTPEFLNPDNGDTLQVTTTGLMYWSDSHLPTWTNGWLHVMLAPGDQLVRWENEDLDPPTPPLVASSATATVSGSSTAWPISGPLGARIYCVEGIESSHGRAMYNPRGWPPPLYNEHAQGWLGFLPSTARAWGAAIGNRASEWAAAARMIAAGRGRQFYGIASGRC